MRAPMAARAFQPGQFYRLQNFETLAPRVERHGAGDGRPRADRRVGRPREGAALDDRARDGRLVRSVRAAEAGRAGDPDGPDGHADRDARAGDRAAGRRRAGQRGAVLHRAEAARRRLAGGLLRRLQEDHRPLQGRRDREGGRRGGLVLRRGPGLHAEPRRRTGRSSATSSRRWWRTASGELGEPTIPLDVSGPPHRDRLGRHDGGGAAGAARRARSRTSSPSIMRSAASTRRCSA